MFSTNIHTVKNIELIKNQSVKITNIHNSRIRISPQQTHGTPGIILSQQIPLSTKNSYIFRINCKFRDFTRIFLWLADNNNELLKYQYLKNGHNICNLTDYQGEIKVGILFTRPRVSDYVVLESFTIDINKTTPIVTDKNTQQIYDCRQEIQMAAECISDLLDTSTLTGELRYYFEQSPRSKKKLDYDVSSELIQQRLMKLKNNI